MRGNRDPNQVFLLLSTVYNLKVTLARWAGLTDHFSSHYLFITVILYSDNEGAGMAQSEQSLGYRTDYRMIEVRFPVGVRDFPLAEIVQTSSGAHTASIQWIPEVPSPGLKRRECEADHLRPSIAIVLDTRARSREKNSL